MADLVRMTLDDGTEVFFQAAESDLVSLRGGGADAIDGGRLSASLNSISEAAAEISASLKEAVKPDEIALEFGVTVSGEVNWWFFAKTHAEATIKVTVKWASGLNRATQGDSA